MRVVVAAAVAVIVAATLAPVAAAEAWWSPLGLRGQQVTAVMPESHGLLARTGGAIHCLPLPGGPSTPVCTPGAPVAPAWSISRGRVLHRTSAGAEVVDPGSPDLGVSARLIAAPEALPGEVVAVDADGIVWRRTATGSWGRSLLLLPAGLLSGAPAVTGLAAFETSELTTSVYLGTDGYAVLVSVDGGEDWYRAAPGLPDGVLALATDAPTQSVYAGTRDGVWVHHLEAIPEPPVYRPSALRNRWVEIAGLTAGATLAAVAVLALAGRRPRMNTPKATNEPKGSGRP